MTKKISGPPKNGKTTKLLKEAAKAVTYGKSIIVASTDIGISEMYASWPLPLEGPSDLERVVFVSLISGMHDLEFLVKTYKGSGVDAIFLDLPQYMYPNQDSFLEAMGRLASTVTPDITYTYNTKYPVKTHLT